MSADELASWVAGMTCGIVLWLAVTAATYWWQDRKVHAHALASSAEYQRKWRASKGARTGAPGRPPTAPCGTAAAYKRHKRHREEPCPACSEAYKVEQRRLYTKRKGKQT